MSKNLSKFAGAALSTCAVLGLGAGPALAASSDGAEVVNEKGCYEADPHLVCYKFQGEYNLVATPGENSIFQANGRYDFTVYDNGNVLYSDSFYGHYHNVVKKGEQQVIHERIRYTTQYDNQTCTLEYTFHYVNGRVHIDDHAYECVSS